MPHRHGAAADERRPLREHATQHHRQTQCRNPQLYRHPGCRSTPQGIDPNSDEFFHLWRSQRVSGGEGRGIFDSVNREQNVDGARAQYGRTAYSNANVEPPARIERIFVQDSPVQGRTMGYR